MPEETTQTPPVETPAETAAPVAPASQDSYQETDVFAWANNLVQFKDELHVELFLINKNHVLYKTNMSKELTKQLEPLFIDEMLDYILEGAEKGLIVRGFEDAEAESHVLQRTRLSKVDRLQETLQWFDAANQIETFVEEEHDFRRIKGIMARVSHAEMDKPFYVFKVLPQSQIMRGKTGWMVRGGKFIPFDAEAALRVPSDPQLLLLEQDLYVFNQTKLKQLFGYDAKEASIAAAKIAEIEANFNLVFDEGDDMQTLVKGKRALIKKLQTINPYAVKQDELMNQAEELGIDLMQDSSGSIIIMDDKDLSKFVNLLNEDYIESPITGLRYEIVKKKLLKLDEDDDLAPQDHTQNPSKQGEPGVKLSDMPALPPEAAPPEPTAPKS